MKICASVISREVVSYGYPLGGISQSFMIKDIHIVHTPKQRISHSIILFMRGIKNHIPAVFANKEGILPENNIQPFSGFYIYSITREPAKTGF